MKNFFSKITQIHYANRYSLVFIASFIVLIVPSLFYYAVISIKNFLYKTKILKEIKPDIYTICIGNLTTGGVGKTPVVCEIANYLESKGKKVVILSRGYGGKLDNKNVNLIKNYKEILIFDTKLSGDEARVISDNTKNCAVITCKNRLKGAKFAKEQLDADILLLDDGFSNRKIEKDLNIVVVDSKKQFGNGFVLPLGPLREPLCELKRADKIIISNKGETISDRKFSVNIPVIRADFIQDGLYDMYDNKVDIKNKDIIAFCAIGQPEQFYSYLSEFNIKDKKTYDDHYEYRQKDADDISACAGKYNVTTAVTTQKDAVKLKNLNFDNIEILVLKIKPDINFDGILNNETF